ncbi:hypothetical protein [Bailinhaonella thermotolerans]|uniref:Uncharacterized protein n=1 Tax=Bailinhaonella thermotolerans TaxID=1070861 RepID=A0A3A4BC14_9ACTN|nr:hypothetical protein [Bailinhaonella thermotolerans]RJL35636.1 hypothetical protein D5H75_02280 [Bailinhaonella thermotolerans]
MGKAREVAGDAAVPAALTRIEWRVRRDEDASPSYSGYLGGARAFFLFQEFARGRWRMWVHLPGEKGARATVRALSLEDAQHQADLILKDFLTLLGDPPPTITR